MAERKESPTCIGLLAHVDAGKTTLSEQLLYHANAIRHLGRVDHGDAFLDDHPIERERGITVFSGQACFQVKDRTFYLLDTPGHTDFSAEMERAVSVMDAAVLVISCVEGVQSHTETVWGLLKEYSVPVLLFLNKTDRTGADPERVLREIRSRLTGDVLDLRSLQHSGTWDENSMEAAAALDEDLLEDYLSGAWQAEKAMACVRRLFAGRGCFPVLSGAGLTGEGVDGLLNLLTELVHTEYEDAGPLRARVYRIRHEENGGRLCFLKLLRGTIQVKDQLPVKGEEARINELRIYHGGRFQSVQKAEAGEMVTIPGMADLQLGDVIGDAKFSRPRLLPMMAADLVWDASKLPSFQLMEKLRPLQEEEPSLRFEERNGRISCRVMGKVQLEILKRLIQERIGVSVDFGPRRIIYRETVAGSSVGVGHYEPLRHYAEVVLRLSPGKPGSGITFRSSCHVDDLALNWQRLIETHIFERPYAGVLTGAELTDVQVELLAGRAHPKHTEGGDFRQAVSRAMRNALMYGQSVLLEPVASFALSVPRQAFGPVQASLMKIQAEMAPAEMDAEDRMLISGECPLGLFMAWQEDYASLTHGQGTLRFRVEKEAPCRDAEAVIQASGYNPLAQDPPDSVFCTHGAGTNVAWYKVREWAHCTGPWRENWE